MVRGIHNVEPSLGVWQGTLVHLHLLPIPKQRRHYFKEVNISNLFRTPTMSFWGQLTAASGGILMPEVMSWMYEAHWVKLAPVRSTVVSPAKKCVPGGGGGTAIRELACRALFSRSLRTEASNGASKSVT